MRSVNLIGFFFFFLTLAHVARSDSSNGVKRLFYVSYDQIPQLREQYIDYFVVLMSHSELTNNVAEQYKELSDETLKILSLNA